MRNDQQIESIWEEFSQKLLGFIQSKVISKEQSEDILQEVFLKIYKGLDSLENQKKLQSWLYTITRNAIFDFYKQKIYVQEFDDTYLQIGEELEEKSFDEIGGCLSHMIYSLPDKYKNALAFVDHKGYSQVKLAQELGISESGAKSRVQRGRKLIKQMFIDCCNPELGKDGSIVEVQLKENCETCGRG